MPLNLAGLSSTDTATPRLPGCLGREFPQQGPKPDAPGLRLSFKLMPHIVIKTDGDRNTHGFNLLIPFALH